MPRISELSTPLSPANGELVRAFVREAAMAEDLPAPAATQAAEDAARAWEMLSADTDKNERARIRTRPTRQGQKTTIVLRGKSRFSSAGSRLAELIRPNVQVEWHEHGIDGFELTIRRDAADPAPPAVPTEAPAVASSDGGDYAIDLVRREDAAGIARCFLAVYGHSYVHPEVLSPKRYWAQVESGSLIAAVARDASGEVVGHTALERGPGNAVAERGEAVVLSQHRGHKLLERMTARLDDEATRAKLHGIYAEPLTIHTYSQKNDERDGMPVCAALLGANPEGTHPKGLEVPTAGQRQSYLRTFRFVESAKPRTVHWPKPYREIIARIAVAIGMPAQDGTDSRPATGESQTRLRVTARGLAVIGFQHIGEGVAIELEQALHDVASLGAVTVQVSGRLDDPGLPALVEAARAQGFFFCGLGPAFADGADTLILQRLSQPLDVSKLQLYTDLARELVGFIESDRVSVSR